MADTICNLCGTRFIRWLNSDGWVRLNGLYLIHHIFYILKKIVTSGLKKGVTRVDLGTFPNNILTLYLHYPIGPTILLVRPPHIWFLISNLKSSGEEEEEHAQTIDDMENEAYHCVMTAGTCTHYEAKRPGGPGMDNVHFLRVNSQFWMFYRHGRNNVIHFCINASD